MFGAGTYIGNGPNFMVKSIAEQSQVKVPSFMGYVVYYSLPILGPLFAGIWFLFFR
jgi:Na+/H+ antiporter NhaD/arsenite permease-like protein